MCGGVHFEYQGEVYKSFFPNPYANLPVRRRDGELELMPWGRREKQEGSLPLGGWARIDSIYAGKWDKYFPVPVKIPVLRYMEKDFANRSRWYDLIPSQGLQGLIARSSNSAEKRLYVVTIDPDIAMRDYHDRLPRIIDLPGKVVISLTNSQQGGRVGVEVNEKSRRENIYLS